jgi:hypothetical protein
MPDLLRELMAMKILKMEVNDSGNIDETSLTLNRSTLTWRKDGVVGSATLY